MKTKYLLFIAIVIASFIGFSACGDETVRIPDPQEGISDDDDGVVEEPTTKSIIRLNLDKRYQEIDGFGCAFAEWSHRIYVSTVRDEVMRRLFGKEGLNLSFMRGEVFPHYETDGVVDFGMDREFDMAGDNPILTNRFWVEVPNRVQLGQMWLTDHLKTRYPHVRLLYSTWSPPASMKTNGSSSGGAILDSKKQDFANYLIDFVRAYEAKFGTRPYAISPTNEPNSAFSGWSTCKWAAEDLADFIVDMLRPTMDAAGYNDVKIMFGEHANWGPGKAYLEKGLNHRPEVANANIIAAAHGYVSTLTEPYTVFEALGIKIWMTEDSDSVGSFNPSWSDGMKWAKKFHASLASGNVSSFIWWAGARPLQNNECLIRLNTEESIPVRSYDETSRFYTFGHYTKYVETGSYRVDVEKDQLEIGETSDIDLLNDLLITAYHKEDRFTIVIVNPSEATSVETLVEVGGKEIQNMQMHVSTENMKWRKSKINPSEVTNSRYLTIPANSMVTLTGKIKS